MRDHFVSHQLPMEDFYFRGNWHEVLFLVGFSSELVIRRACGTTAVCLACIFLLQVSI